MTYSYDPKKIRLGGKDQMRFELGDTAVHEGAEWSALSDEEYFAFLGTEKKNEKSPRNWSKQKWLSMKIALVEGILHRLSFQVDTKIDSLSYEFSPRIGQWQLIYEGLKKEESLSLGLPVVSGSGKKKDYFWSGIHDWG